MSTGVAFLQTGYDEAPKNVGTFKPGNTDVIRQMLREQQKECQVCMLSLHSYQLHIHVRHVFLANPAVKLRGHV
jgi:hypothetical protein